MNHQAGADFEVSLGRSTVTLSAFSIYASRSEHTHGCRPQVASLNVLSRLARNLLTEQELAITTPDLSDVRDVHASARRMYHDCAWHVCKSQQFFPSRL